MGGGYSRQGKLVGSSLGTGGHIMPRGFLNYEVGDGQVVGDEVGAGAGSGYSITSSSGLPSLQPPLPAVSWVISPLCCQSKCHVLTHIHNVRPLCGNSFFSCLSPLDCGLFESKDCAFYPCIQCIQAQALGTGEAGG